MTDQTAIANTQQVRKVLDILSDSPDPANKALLLETLESWTQEEWAQLMNHYPHLRTRMRVIFTAGQGGEFRPPEGITTVKELLFYHWGFMRGRRRGHLESETTTALSTGPANPETCDADVFTYGVSVGLFDITKEEAEAYCKRASSVTGRKHDWHYIAGRVHIKAQRGIGLNVSLVSATEQIAKIDPKDLPEQTPEAMRNQILSVLNGMGLFEDTSYSSGRAHGYVQGQEDAKKGATNGND